MGLFTDIPSLIPQQDTIAVGDLILEPGWKFEIPFNQRPWVWKDSNLRDLWGDLQKTKDDFFEATGKNGKLKPRKTPLRNPHYFGAFLLYERAPGQYEVVDGQQRLTSVCMLAAIWREIARSISSEEQNPLELRLEAENLEASLTRWLLFSSNPSVPRLQLDSQFDDFFRTYVVEPRNSNDRAQAYADLGSAVKSRKGSRQLKRGFDTLRECVMKDMRSRSDSQVVNQIGALESVLETAFIGSRIVVRDEAFAFSVFGTLNARGVPLSAADKIKNELFEHSQSSEHKQIKEDWDAIYEHVPEGNVELFLRLRHLAFVNSDCPKRALFKNVSKRELKGEDPTDVTARWRKDAELLSRLTVEKSHPKIKGEVKRHLETLHRQLKITYSWPLLLSAGHRFLNSDPDEFGKLVRLTLAFCFRVLTIGEADVADLERPVAQTALSLTKGAVPSKIAKKLREENSDDEFEEAFSEAVLHRAATQFYALYELEVHRAKGGGLSLEPFPHSPQQNVEHILPRNPSMAEARIDEWSVWRYASGEPTEEHSEYVNRLGNLLILEGEINGDISNYDFEAKRTGAYPGQAATHKGRPRKSFKDSKLSLVKDVLDKEDYPEWTADDIDWRQEQMAAEAAKAWTLRYV